MTAPSLCASLDSGSVKKRHGSTSTCSSTGQSLQICLQKSLKTYREDIYRTLGSLTEKGMVNPSLDSPTVYAAVDIKTALDTTLKKFENELREMEMTKQELQELLNQQRFLLSHEFPTYKIFKTVKDVFFIYSTSFRVCSL